MSDLSTKELHLIQLIAEESQSQRRLAEKSGFSLGMTNILLKKLASKGYIKVVQLNGRTLRYILTPRGFKEKLRRTHSFLQESIRRLRRFRRNLLELLESRLSRKPRIWVLGQGEVAELAAEILEESGLGYDWMRALPPELASALDAGGEVFRDRLAGFLSSLGEERRMRLLLLADPEWSFLLRDGLPPAIEVVDAMALFG